MKLLERFKLKMFDIDSTDWYIARDIDDLVSMMNDEVGDGEDYREVSKVISPWSRMTRIDDPYLPGEEQTSTTHWVWLWCLLEGRGFFASTEF